MYVIAPSGPPVDVTFGSRSKNTILISWKAPLQDERNGEVTGYEVCYSDQAKSDNPTCIKTNAILSYTIKNLQPSTKYFVTIAAGTSVGFGPRSFKVHKTTNGGKQF